jgi:hypothetical protein
MKIDKVGQSHHYGRTVDDRCASGEGKIRGDEVGAEVEHGEVLVRVAESAVLSELVPRNDQRYCGLAYMHDGQSAKTGGNRKRGQPLALREGRSTSLPKTFDVKILQLTHTPFQPSELVPKQSPIHGQKEGNPPLGACGNGGHESGKMQKIASS